MSSKQPSEDVQVHSACYNCFSPCGTMVRRVNGVVVKIEGDPDCPHNSGRLCPKGQAAIMDLYDPNRVKTPLMRTNPEKGLGVDPRWKELSWDEALDIVGQRLRRARAEDPRKVVLAIWDLDLRMTLAPAWASALGTPNMGWGGYFCGNYLHAVMYLTNGSFHSDFDINYCNYVILLGNQMGFMAGLNPNPMSQRMAEARMRGMRVVVVDPVGTNAAAKADEWLPIRPGTDGAFVLAVINVLLNELGVYDADFLQRHTNAGYLVGRDGHYVRDASRKPLVWDEAEGKAKPYDSPGAKPALLGSYTVGTTPCQPAFQLLKEHVRAYTPEVAAEATTIPAATIRRIAREYGEAARIGSTIVIEGKELPYRPVAINIYRGAGAHKHGTLTGLAVQILNMVVGAMYVPGGHRGVNLLGYQGNWAPGQTEEGMVLPPDPIGHKKNYYVFDTKAPESLYLHELYPISTNLSPQMQLSVDDPHGYRLPYVPEVLIQCRTSLMTNKVKPQQMAETLKKIPFMVSISRMLDETAEFADIVLPDTHTLERLDLFPNNYTLSVEPSTGYWYWGVRQPVVPAAYQAKNSRDIFLEMAERAGFREELLTMLNGQLGLKGSYRLDPKQRYNWEQIFDRWAKSEFGEDKGLDWFREHGYHKLKRSVEENYPLPFVQARFPVYFENMIRAGGVVRSIADELELPWDTSDYQGLPDWKPCPAFHVEKPEYDLFVANYKLPFHFQSWTTENPWLNELAERHPYAYKLMMNTTAAARKGIVDGDTICVESEFGKVQGRVKVTECIHPEVVAIAGVFGSWAQGKPVARGKGVHFNSLFGLSRERMDPISTAADACIRVKVYKASV